MNSEHPQEVEATVQAEPAAQDKVPEPLEAPAQEVQATSEAPAQEVQVTAEAPAQEVQATAEAPAQEVQATAEAPAQEVQETTEAPAQEVQETSEVAVQEVQVTTEAPAQEVQETTEAPAQEVQATTEETLVHPEVAPFEQNPAGFDTWAEDVDFKPKLWVKKLFDDGTELSPIICPKDVSDAQVVRQTEQNLRILPGININVQGQLAMLDQLGAMWTEVQPSLPWPAEERGTELRFHYENPSYSYFDAMSLAAMLQRLKPKRILAFVDEFQYACFMDILERLQLSAVCKFIEPDPRRLETYAPLPQDSPHTIICSTLKLLERKHFDQLEAGDVLFVDTTHVAKAGSDVCRLFSQVLPCLAPYVWVQIHDVFWPFEYPDGWLREGRSWNELYVLRAWLQFNSAVEVKLLLNYLWLFYEADCIRNFPDSKLNPGGALWIMRK